MRLISVAVWVVPLAACPPQPLAVDDGGVDSGVDAGPSVIATEVTCHACTTNADCFDAGTCVQYAGSDFCGRPCGTCPTGESCLLATADDGTQASVCVPDDGTCGKVGCGTCPSGTSCDPIAGQCGASMSMPDGGLPPTDAGTCGTYDLPSTPSCCHSCTPGSGGCGANHCYGGWWCDRSTCRCHAPAATASCTVPDAGQLDAGIDAGVFDAGGRYDGGVGPGGGLVPHLYFAVVGDTRPNQPDDTPNYPTAVITKIYQDIATLDPRPQFVIATGDYMFTAFGNTSHEGTPQMALYTQARAAYPGPVFGAMGNHECTGGNASDCSGFVSLNMQAYLNALVVPLGYTQPYYSFDVNDTAGQWTAKFLMTSCNTWSSAQKTWFTTQLARATTYTFVIRHHPLFSDGPCNTEQDPMIQAATYTALLVGHTHSVYFSAASKQLVEGVAGAPISGSANYGYATVEQRPAGGFTVLQYDYQTNMPVGTYLLP
jgi:hypothetical protein